LGKVGKTAEELTALVTRHLPGNRLSITRDATHGWSLNIVGKPRDAFDLKMAAGEIAFELSTRYELDEPGT
jgi:hypothetical protein